MARIRRDHHKFDGVFKEGTLLHRIAADKTTQDLIGLVVSTVFSCGILMWMAWTHAQNAEPFEVIGGFLLGALSATVACRLWDNDTDGKVG